MATLTFNEYAPIGPNHPHYPHHRRRPATPVRVARALHYVFPCSSLRTSSEPSPFKLILLRHELALNMGKKRKSADSQENIRRKIRKLEEKLKKTRCRRVIMSSSDEEHYSEYQTYNLQVVVNLEK